MERRQASSERKWFTTDEKEYMLNKSDYRCCHCGKTIGNKMGFTVEHVVPISKGGTNDMVNMVALCKECNHEKGNDVVQVQEYYKYLKPCYMEKLLKYSERYLYSVKWIDNNNFIPYDKIELEINTGYVYGHGKKKAIIGKAKYTLMRAQYCDLDDVYNLRLKYEKKYKFYGKSKEEIKEDISFSFKNGAIYVVRDRNNEAVMCFDLCFTEDKEGLRQLAIVDVHCLYNSDKYIDMANKAFVYVAGSIARGIDMKYISLMLTLDTRDPLHQTISRRMFGRELSSYTRDFLEHGKIISFVAHRLNDYNKLSYDTSEDEQFMREMNSNKEKAGELMEEVSERLKCLIEKGYSRKAVE